MPYGTGGYGGSPYAGFAVEGGGPVLISSTPLADATSVATNATVELHIQSTVDLDQFSLNVYFDGTPAILAGDFLPGYGGIIDFQTTDAFITISTHPAFEDGRPVDVDTTILDVAAESGEFGFTLNIGQATIATTETVTITEAVTLLRSGSVAVSETINIVEGTEDPDAHLYRLLSETVAISESLAFVAAEGTPDGFGVSTPIAQEARLDGVADVSNYSIRPLDGGVPVVIESASYTAKTLQQGSTGSVGPADPQSAASHKLSLPGSTFTSANIGDYIQLAKTADSWNGGGVFARILSVPSSTEVIVDQPLVPGDPENGSLVWTHLSGVQNVQLRTTKFTNGKRYELRYRLRHKATGAVIDRRETFTAKAARPHLTGVEFLPDGDVVVTFGEPMLWDEGIVDAADYTITGPSAVRVKEVIPVSPTQVRLTTVGFSSGSYTLTINPNGTPKDVAGNPIDATFNTAAFSSSVPLTARSVFTDKGPIAKPPLTVATGGTASVVSLTEINCPTATFTPSVVGLYLTLAGSTNGGTYRVAGVVSSTRLRLTASFTLPDPLNGSLTWTLFDPRDGEIADDPSDVTVRVNGTPVVPDAVIGLLGQVVLPTMPAPTDDVKIDYSWVPNPTVEIRRLNSKEFVLNGWARDRQTHSPTMHRYRFNSVLTKPSDYNVDDLSAGLPKPLQRDLFYRGYERAYTASLNDPTTLVLNTPHHRIAYPQLSRAIEHVNVSYFADTLPESDPMAPWVRVGTGTAVASGGNLTISDTTTSDPLFWTREIDLTFPHVFAATWRVQVDSVTDLEGVWTGTGIGWSDDHKTLVVGFLLDGTTRKIGFLKKGAGNDPSDITAWAGGFDSLGNPTGAPVAFDWSTLHSYRLYRDRDGNVRLYVDGEVVESLRATQLDLPYLEELYDPFKTLQGVFFGSLSRPGRVQSTWDFIRYLVLPTNPQQNAPSRFTSYEADVIPEDSPEPWTPVGYHGTETILAADTLLLDSTSATTLATEDLVGYTGGDFRGYVRMEPLLSASSDVVLDVNAQLRTWTHGLSPNSVMAAVDDGDRLVQLSFLSGSSSPKVSYPGRTLPTAATPSPWSSLGTADATMHGRTLRITDASTTDGRIFYIDDSPVVSDAIRIAKPTGSYMLESRLKVISTTPDAGGFAGVTMDVFDGDPGTTGRVIGLMLREVSGVKYVALHSDGTVVAQWAFNWLDGKVHTYRVVKTQAIPDSVVSVFVDAQLLGTEDYTAFASSVGPGTISFGSATSTSNLARSVVDWHYCNAWKVADASTPKYVGLWKGRDGDSLLGYHLPTKVPVQAATVAGNALTDPAGNFLARGVVVGDPLVIDEGPNRGVYEIAGVPSANSVTVVGVFPSGPTITKYRIPAQTDWTAAHRYRVVRTPAGSVTVILDAIEDPIINVSYGVLDLPSSTLGLPRLVNGAIPSVMFGAFDPTNLSSSAWDYVHYGITRSPTELRICPPHQTLNQRNVMASPDHIFTTIPHDHTSFSSSSTGIPPRSLYDNPAYEAFTKLNEGTPLMPKTQSWEVRKPTPVFEPISGLNRVEDVLNGDRDFLLNDNRKRVKLLVPKDVLYTALEVIERTDGEEDLLTPFTDENEPIAMGKMSFTKEVCLDYTGDVLPENDTNVSTPWVLASDSPTDVTTTLFSGVLTYGTGSAGTRTIYRNATPLPDAISLQTQVTFKLKLVNDGSFGTGDTGVRYGFSALGLTCALGWRTDAFGNRLVEFIDLNTEKVLAQVPFDYDDGNFHTYRFVKDPGSSVINFYIDG